MVACHFFSIVECVRSLTGTLTCWVLLHAVLCAGIWCVQKLGLVRSQKNALFCSLPSRPLPSLFAKWAITPLDSVWLFQHAGMSVAAEAVYSVRLNPAEYCQQNSAANTDTCSISACQMVVMLQREWDFRFIIKETFPVRLIWCLENLLPALNELLLDAQFVELMFMFTNDFRFFAPIPVPFPSPISFPPFLFSPPRSLDCLLILGLLLTQDQCTFVPAITLLKPSAFYRALAFHPWTLRVEETKG